MKFKKLRNIYQPASFLWIRPFLESIEVVLELAGSQIFGAESSGKTLIATKIMAHTQRMKGFAIFLDFEHAFSLPFGMRLGLSNDPKLWYYRQPTTAEEGLDIVYKACATADKDGRITVVVDSVASMVTAESLEGGLEGANMKTKLSLAALLSQQLPVLAQKIHNSNSTIIFLNQTRKNPGVMFGDKESTTGGMALKFYASTRIKLSRMGKEKDDDKNIIGEKVNCSVIKNKIHRPFEEANYVVHYTEGMNIELSHILDLKARGLLGDTKGWLMLGKDKFRLDDLVKLAKSDPKVNKELLDMFKD